MSTEPRPETRGDATRALLGLLPIRSTEQFLPKLAETLREAFAANRVTLAEASRSGRSARAVVAVEGRACFVAGYEVERNDLQSEIALQTPGGEWRLAFDPAVSLEQPERMLIERLLAQAMELDRRPSVEEFERRLLEEKLEAMAEFSAGAGHEINNPAATIAGRARMLLADETDPERKRSLATIGAQAYRIRDMIGDAMLFARPPQPEPTVFPLASLLQELLPPLQESAAAVPCTISIQCEESISIFADRNQIGVAITALIENAINAAVENGAIKVAATSVEKDDRATTQIQVADNGTGFTDVERRHLFDPFFSGRQAGRGLGFGLPKAWRIAEMAGGAIRYLEESNETEFTLTLPSGSIV
ncbi:sensor histidine kinase [Stratiformator vulcanicus]|uniref:histidine kinase n=1 Tax=Stratiformator vulcanicus TaxID=2527980 RepID=A0A517R4U2_9PLAN|nr:HAMP domain-containing sensor histidine kinase [Stratiformator vulcanicus]QDT38909.1 Sporulation kinase D [Stratiformator vulcanicus]